MNQANQKAVIQEANMSLVGIRAAELDYFNTFYANFATQAILLIGCFINSFSQVPALRNPSSAPPFFKVLYWISAAVTISFAVHSLICSVFVQVFGQGLGLRGPLGSMIVAIEGMVYEQEQILRSFTIGMFAFGINCISMFWIMMDQDSAIPTTIVIIVAMVVWYKYAVRLFNRFSWKSMKVDWKEENDPEEEFADLDPSIMMNNQNKEYSPSKSNNKEKKGKKSNPAPAADEEEEGKSVASDNMSTTTFSVKELNDLEETPTDTAKGHVGAYLTIKIPKTFGDPWQRRYFLVKGTSVYYYKDQKAFQLDPANPINKRPIDLEGYSLLAAATQAPYMMTLVPIDEEDIRKAWDFRTDTLAEYTQWIKMFRKALKKTKMGQRIGEEIVKLQLDSASQYEGEEEEEM